MSQLQARFSQKANTDSLERLLQYAEHPKLWPLASNFRYQCIHGGRGSGKCLQKGTKVIMFDGSLRAVEDVKVEDLLMGPDSLPRTVLNTTHGVGPLYRVEQTSAMTYVVNDAHILSLKKSLSCANDRGELSPAGNYRRPAGRYPDWGDIVNIPVLEYVNKSKRWKEHFRGYKSRGWHFDEQPVEIDPYILGAWLGDGHAHAFSFTSMDDEIKCAFEDFASKNNGILVNWGTRGRATSWNLIKKSGSGEKSFINLLRNYNLYKNKHVPHVYIQNSEEVRLGVLAGIVDTDGHKCTGYYEVIQTNEVLIRGIKLIADSLGFRTSLREKKTSCAYKGEKVFGTAWRLNIAGDIARIPCKLPRKIVEVGELKPNKDKSLSYLKVEPIGEGEYFGFELDGDHLFCLEDGTVTHNSFGITEALVLWSDVVSDRFLLCREHMNSLADSCHAQMESHIEHLNLKKRFIVTKTGIKNRATGSEFLYRGLRTNINSVKSLVDIGFCFVEEAQAVSDPSWKILLPTIRKGGSRVIIACNPEDENSFMQRRWITNPCKNTAAVQMNYCDNPYFPQELEDERQYALRLIETAPNEDARLQAQADYDWVWEGHTKRITAAQIIRRVEVKEFEAPYGVDFMFGMDFGFAQDPNALVRCFVIGEDLYVDYESVGRVELNELPQLMNVIPEVKRWPIYADSARPETISHLKPYGYHISSVPKWQGSVEDGIAYLNQFHRIYVHPRCTNLIRESKEYKYKTDRVSGDVLPVPIDKENHVIDALRYSIVNLIKSGGKSFLDF